MPSVNGFGYGPHSDAKQDDFRSFLSLHIEIVDRITEGQEWKRKYTFIDMNAGPGYFDKKAKKPVTSPNDDTMTGSPIYFLDEIEKTTIRYRAIFIEREKVNSDNLQQIIDQRTLRSAPKIANDDHVNFLKNHIMSYTDKTYGLLYHDPTGEVPHFDLLAEASRAPAFGYVDFMIYLSANSIKRVRRMQEAMNQEAKVKLLTDYLKAIKKKIWIIRKPKGNEQWTFALGSNWDNFPDWKKRGFHRIDSRAGEEILESLTYTDKELAARSGQQSLFDLPEMMEAANGDSTT
jgi:three-Cys-motif partner protein